MIGNPFPLKQNEGKSFQGSILTGTGFILPPEEARALIAKDSRNREVLFPYLNGDDLNNDPLQQASRWVINFFDWPEEKVKTYPDCFSILEQRVKPERQRWKVDRNGNDIVGTYALSKPLHEKWWIYEKRRNALYETISKLDQVMVINRHAKHWIVSFGKTGIVYSEATIVLAINSYYIFAVLCSILHETWAWKRSSTMGAATLRYSTTRAFETFPFPLGESKQLERLGSEINLLRKSLTESNKIGLTEVQNYFHSQNILNSNQLYADILKLRSLQMELDEMVLKEYSWGDIKLRHDFYEVEYLPEHDRIRFTAHPEARREIFKRLLLLNQKRHQEEDQLSYQSKSKTKVALSGLDTGLFSN